METSLKQRLVGAAIIVAVFVIAVPAFLDGPDQARTVDRLDMPATPDASETRRLPVYEQEPDAADSEQALERDDAVEPVIEFRSGEQRSPGQGAEQPTATPSPDLEPEDRALTPSEAQTAQPPAAEEESRPADSEPTAAEEPSSSQTVSEDREEATSNERASNASAQASEPPDRAEPAPVADDAAADSAAARPAVAAFAVQVGGFADQGNALGLREQLRQKGFSAYVESVQSNGRTIYRVRVGPAPDRQQAEALLERLRNETDSKGIVVSHP